MSLQGVTGNDYKQKQTFATEAFWKNISGIAWGENISQLQRWDNPCHAKQSIE